MNAQPRRGRAASFEAALWIVMVGLAFLAKDDPRLIYPQVLYFFSALLASTLAASLSVRLAPDRTWLHALALLSGLASIAGVQEWSGGTDSALWALYLLPLFSAAILLDARALAWTTLGACAADSALYIPLLTRWSPSASFELALKTAVLACAAAGLGLMARAEREAEERVRVQRREIEMLEESSRAATAAWEKERGMRTVSAAAARAAHDLSTPLMVVRSYAKLHLERGVADPVLAKDLSRIESAAAFCQGLCADLMSRASEAAAPRRLITVVEAAAALAEPVLRTRHVELEIAVVPGLSICAVAQDVERVLLNLLGNAAKAMQNGGRVRVSARREERDGKSWAIVCVEDDGPGLPEAVLARLFQPFTTTGGTGLGLHLSREAARRLGGDLSAENIPGGGARFTLRLPAQPAPSDANAYSRTTS